MTSDAYPIHEHETESVNPFRRIARVLHSLMRRASSIDVRYVDPWERQRR